MDLAGEASFRLGEASVDPPRLQLAGPGGEADIQPRAMQVLVRLARAPGVVVSRDALIADCWGGRAVSDDSINRVIHLLRQLARQGGGQGFSIETVAKVGYRLVIARSAEPAPSEPLLAVLPFDNLTGDAGLDYFADGLSEEILYTVAKTTPLKVVGRSSSFSLRGPGKSPANASEILGATHVLDGSVRGGGERLRIAAQLMACGEATPLWSDRFERRLADVLAVEDEIAGAVAAALNVAVVRRPPRPPVDPEAYTLYLRARDPKLDGIIANIPLLEQAVARAPEFAEAWAILAYSRGMLVHWGLGSGVFADRRGEVLEAAETALRLDPAAGAAYLALTTIEPVCGRFAEHRRLVGQALAVAPNDPLVLSHACGRLDVVGRQGEALGLIQRAYALDPRLVGWYHAYMLDAVGRPDAARAAYDRDLERWPEVAPLNANALRAAYEARDWPRYDWLWAGLSPTVAQAPVIRLVGGAAARLRHWNGPEADAAEAELRGQLTDTGTVSLALCALLAGGGRAEAVHAALERARFDHLFTPEGKLAPADFGLNLLFSPFARALRRDPRFARLCVRLGLGAFWAASGEWPDCVAELAPFYDLEAEVRRALLEAA